MVLAKIEILLLQPPKSGDYSGVALRLVDRPCVSSSLFVLGFTKALAQKSAQSYQGFWLFLGTIYIMPSQISIRAFLLCFVALGVEPRPLLMLKERSITELHPTSQKTLYCDCRRKTDSKADYAHLC